MSDQEDNNLITTKNKTSVLSSLKQSEVLREEDWNHLNDSKDFITDCFSSVPMYRPLPIKIFGVLNDNNFPTPESKYWQCKVEAEVHSDQLIEDIHNLELARISFERADYTRSLLYKSFENEDDMNKKKEIEFDIKEISVTISKLEYKIIKLKKQIKYRIDEVHDWKKISDKIKSAHTNIEVSDYVKHYVNNMKDKLISQSKSNPPEDGEKEEEDQLKKFESIVDKLSHL